MEKEPEEYYYGVVITVMGFFKGKQLILILIPFILYVLLLEVLPQCLLIHCLGVSGWSRVLDDTDMPLLSVPREHWTVAQICLSESL